MQYADTKDRVGAISKCRGNSIYTIYWGNLQPDDDPMRCDPIRRRPNWIAQLILKRPADKACNKRCPLRRTKDRDPEIKDCGARAWRLRYPESRANKAAGRGLALINGNAMTRRCRRTIRVWDLQGVKEMAAGRWLTNL